MEVSIILAAFTLSGELENGQIKSEIIRICSRSKIVAAKYAALGQWNLLGMTGLFQVLFSLVVVNTFSTEIDRGQVKMAILRQCSRKKLVYAKICVLALFMLVSYLCYIAFSIGCYYGFVVRTDYGTGEFISEAVRAYGITKFIVSGVFVLIDALVTAGIVFLFSLRFKTGVCFMLAIGTTTLLLPKLLSNVLNTEIEDKFRKIVELFNSDTPYLMAYVNSCLHELLTDIYVRKHAKESAYRYDSPRMPY